MMPTKNNQIEERSICSLRMFLFLQGIADEENGWEYGDGTPMAEDAKKLIDWILSNTMRIDEIEEKEG